MTDNRLTVYIAGPVTGVDRYWETFELVDDDLTGRGFTVLNPARLPSTLPHEKAMPICMAMVEAADAVVLLPGWEDSKGATMEKQYAEKLGKPVRLVSNFLQAADAAKKVVEILNKGVTKQ